MISPIFDLGSFHSWPCSPCELLTILKHAKLPSAPLFRVLTSHGTLFICLTSLKSLFKESL